MSNSGDAFLHEGDVLVELNDVGEPVKLVSPEATQPHHSYLVIPKDKFCNPKPDVGGWKWK